MLGQSSLSQKITKVTAGIASHGVAAARDDSMPSMDNSSNNRLNFKPNNNIVCGIFDQLKMLLLLVGEHLAQTLLTDAD